MNSALLITIMGPTASGKSDLAEALADQLDAVLINADAFQVYRGFDIGTGKSARKSEYKLIDIKAPEESYGVGEFVRDACAVLGESMKGGRHCVLVGGTGLYIRALTSGYQEMVGAPDPELREHLQERLKTEGLPALVSELRARKPDLEIDFQNPVRVTRALEKLKAPTAVIEGDLHGYRSLKFGLEMDPDRLKEQIETRVQAMRRAGWVDEVREILASGVSSSAPAMRAIGYFPICRMIKGEVSEPGTWDQICVDTRQYAKRQRTWLRSEPNLRKVSEVTLAERLIEVNREMDLLHLG